MIPYRAALQHPWYWSRALRPVKASSYVSFSTPHYRHLSALQDDLARTRNIGIIAHIDAGKTTTTERMLYYSGFTRRIGDVDEGSTVTDFLPAERARGITIQSAAISFSWPPDAADQGSSSPQTRSLTTHKINLIDTPGHADFTFEVLRSLRVLDGAVCILDGVAGVEAQTETVWAQSLNYLIPRIIFVNKLDRDGASFARTIKEIGGRLGVWPAVCGIPWWTSEGKLKGIGDVVNLRALHYAEGGDGKQIEAHDLQQLESVDAKFAAELRNARTALVELLSEHDDEMVEQYLEADEDHVAIPSNHIINTLRRCVLAPSQVLTPVFAGASFRNVGVQPLLDAVVDLLPSPNERPDPDVSLAVGERTGLADLLAGKVELSLSTSLKKGTKVSNKNAMGMALQNLEACALAFKVVADPKRGVLVYVRVYSGSINRNAALWNTNLQTSERAQKLLKMYANDAVDVETIPAGQIGVIPGLKFARTGDTLISYTGANPKTGPPLPISHLQLRPIDVPPPVFFVSVEANSLSEQKHITESLELLLREDPSLHVTIDEESGQTHLSGMGELHLEIARDRLVQDLKAKARIGQIEIGYREAITTASDEVTETFSREVNGKSSEASCTASVSPHDHDTPPPDPHSQKIALADNNHLILTCPTLHQDGTPIDPDSPSLPDHLTLPTITQAFHNGVSAALARGPTHNYPIHSARITLTFDPAQHLTSNTTASALSSAARLAVQRALQASARQAPTALMEPVMLVTLGVDEPSLGAVVHDLSSARGGSIVSLGAAPGEEEEDGEREGEVAGPRTIRLKGLAPEQVDRIYAPRDPFASGDAGSGFGGAEGGSASRQIVARVPLKEMMGYLRHLRSLTAGRGTFTMVVDRFEKMTAQRQRAVVNELRGDLM